jgi:hypothetical protein
MNGGLTASNQFTFFPRGYGNLVRAVNLFKSPVIMLALMRMLKPPNGSLKTH